MVVKDHKQRGKSLFTHGERKGTLHLAKCECKISIYKSKLVEGFLRLVLIGSKDYENGGGGDTRNLHRREENDSLL